MFNPDPDDQKLRELILFIASRSENDQKFGATKLNKLLFFSDFAAYQRLGKAITGHQYQRLPNGPAPRQFLPITKDMEQSGSLAFQSRVFHGREQKRAIALRPANLRIFSSDEIAIVTEIIDELRTQNARDVSALSHQFKGWKLAKEGETIPYQVVLVEFKRPLKKHTQMVIDNGDEIEQLRDED